MRGERPPKERLRSGNAPIRSQHEVYAAPLLVHSSVQMVAFALDRAWSERPGVVELSPGLSSPNRTCTSQRIRLSIQVLLKAKATSAECTSPACLAFHRLSKVFTLLQSVTVIRHASHSNCLPSPCGRLSRPPTTTRAPSTCTASGDTLPCHLCKPSPVHMLDSTHGRGCLSQSLSLLSASRRGHHVLTTRSPWLPTGRHTCPFSIRGPVPTCGINPRPAY